MGRRGCAISNLSGKWSAPFHAAGRLDLLSICVGHLPTSITDSAVFCSSRNSTTLRMNKSAKLRSNHSGETVQAQPSSHPRRNSSATEAGPSCCFSDSCRIGSRANLGRLIGLSCAFLLVFGDPTPTVRAQNPDEFVREMAQAEVTAQENDQSLWSFRETSSRNGHNETQIVVQTQKGPLERLVAIDGHPLSKPAQEKEDSRLQKLAENPDAMAKKKKELSEDAARERRLIKMLPDAFRYQDAGMEGVLIHLKFSPNPSFHASSREATVFHHLMGDLWIDSQSKRLARISGTLTSEVKFGGGLLGHLNQGGIFSVKQENVGEGQWELTSLNVQMNGKALFFHAIAVHQQQECSDFQPVKSSTTPEQAVAMLEHFNQNEARANPTSRDGN